MTLCQTARAARDHAAVLPFLGRYTEAAKYVERAERELAALDPELVEWDSARLRLAKAIAWGKLQRSDESVALAHQAGQMFLRCGDRRRFLDAAIIEAAMLYDGGAVEKAMDLWKSVEGDRDLDAVGALRVTHNIALCLCDLGRGEEAIAPLRHCITTFAARGMATERTRSRWKLGMALLGAARSAEAIPTLRTASREFAELDMAVDSALAALDLADALLASEEPAEVPELCRQAITALTDAGLAMQAIPALAMLKEAAAKGRASHALIRRTHAAVKSFGREEAQLRA